MPGKKHPPVNPCFITEEDTIATVTPSRLHTLGAPRHEFPALTHVGQVLQESTRFGHSAVWQLMQDFYESRAIKAWNDVPFLITCSANMADAYSDFILGYWQDLPADCPLHIVELSTGSGRLSFLILKLLSEKIQRFPELQGRPFRYVMTDCAQHNIDFWMAHPNFQPYIRQGLLDFARFNPMRDTEIQLLLRNERLQDTAVVGIANYCFDTLPNDFFQVREHKLYESQVTLTLISEDGTLPEQVTRLDVQPLVTYDAARADYYPYPLWNEILAKQKDQYYEASFFFPMGGLSAMEVLKASSNGHFMLLSSDKGYVRKEFHLGRENPECAFHGGAFSVMVNYDIVLEWFRLQDALTASSATDSSLSLETVVGVLGNHPMPHLEQAVYWHLERGNTIGGAWELLVSTAKLEPANSDDKNRRLVHQILGTLRVGLADPFLMADVAPILALISEYIGIYTRKDVMRMAARAWELYYPFPGEPNLPYKLGVLFLCMGEYEKVLACCQVSAQLYPPDARLYGLMGRANEKLHRYRRAMDCYRQALALDATAEIPNERLNALNLLLANGATDEDFLNTLNNYDITAFIEARHQTVDGVAVD